MFGPSPRTTDAAGERVTAGEEEAEERTHGLFQTCLLYTSDAADEL